MVCFRLFKASLQLFHVDRDRRKRSLRAASGYGLASGRSPTFRSPACRLLPGCLRSYVGKDRPDDRSPIRQWTATLSSRA